MNGRIRKQDTAAFILGQLVHEDDMIPEAVEDDPAFLVEEGLAFMRLYLKGCRN